ncbi:hypothetical protein N480_21650 [Pseudoalteromonas luteoviolacea S2607]|uniref:hypothetical protein n=1 Tax=Pseudoalteromonas luteoviolacea TaxID=43657 RepID=UPI0007B1669C|nr:hypothetical protein [Pseudoalteromonas luteoviolacea]KZN34211.1 hypothetical protein N480_21650 [Pseudoalteromonas luteoviolacea S2607]
MKKLLFIITLLLPVFAAANPIAGEFTIEAIRVSDATGITYIYTSQTIPQKMHLA